MSIQSIIRGAPLFYDLHDSEIEAVLENCQVMQLGPGEKIFDFGDKGEDLYLILNGKVDIMKNNVLIATLGKAELFGELILLYEGIRSTDAISIQHTDLLVLNYKSIIRMYDKNPRAMSIMMLNLCRLMAERLKRSNDDVRELRLTVNSLISQLL